jgi:hypothetical protein
MLYRSTGHNTFDLQIANERSTPSESLLIHLLIFMFDSLIPATVIPLILRDIERRGV